MRWHKRVLTFLLIFLASLAAFFISTITMGARKSLAMDPLLRPVPTQPTGHYDYFGELLNTAQAARLVRRQGLDPRNAESYLKVGAVEITEDLIDQGEKIFFERKIGDTFGLQGVFGFGTGLQTVFPELGAAIAGLGGEPTNNVVLQLQKEISLGGWTYPAGASVPTGLDVPRNGSFPIGLTSQGNITCAICHVTQSPGGDRLDGVPNGDLNIPLLVALAPNSAAAFARLNINPLDPQYQGNGKTILDSNNQPVQLPDPQKFEEAFDRLVLQVPFGHFESSPDSISNTTQIPSLFTFQNHPYTAGGEFAVGPFAGLSVTNNAVHSSEINLLAAAQISAETIGIDPEVYLGTMLQNAANPQLRLPDGPPIKPSQWLRLVAPNPAQAELEDQIVAPGAGQYPNARPSLATYNGLVFTPDSGQSDDVASGPFMFANNAMSAWQNSLVPPANKTPANQEAIASGSVQRGAKVFRQANCASCHVAPFFTDNRIHPLRRIGTNPARAESRLSLNELLVAPQLYSFDASVPVSETAQVLDVPTRGISKSSTSLPRGVLPDGGYKTTSLLGLYLSAPYLHDGGVAVREGALEVSEDGRFTVKDESGLGLWGTLSKGIAADPASSLRALVDSQLRREVVQANRSHPELVNANLDGSGHDFFVDRTTGFNPRQQTDLINFLLALDDHPGQF